MRSATFTLTDGGSATLSGAMVPAPQTGTLKANLKLSQFAALASGVRPTAQPSTRFSPGLAVLALAHMGTAVDSNLPLSTYAEVVMPIGLTADVNYGNLSYGRLPENWDDLVQFSYRYVSELPAVLGGSDILLDTRYFTQFVAQSGTGTQPTISWSAPSLGRPTFYQLVLFVTEGAAKAGGIINAVSSSDPIDSSPFLLTLPVTEVNTSFGLFTP